MTYYRQCTLQKRLPDNTTSNQVSWIPEEFCLRGKVLKLLTNGVWVDGWIVSQVGEHRIGEKQLPYVRGEIRSHREATGDALAKSKSP